MMVNYEAGLRVALSRARSKEFRGTLGAFPKSGCGLFFQEML